MAELPTGTVTLLFTRHRGLDAPAAASRRRLRRRCSRSTARCSSEAFARHGGVEVDSEGDAFFVAFASAKDAVAAAADGPARARRSTTGRTGTRSACGWASTPASRAPSTGRYVGLDVHHAARVMAVGHGGQVLRLGVDARAARRRHAPARPRRAPAEGPLAAAAALPARARRPAERVPAAEDARQPADEPARAAERLRRPRARAGRDARAARARRRAAADADRAGRHRQDPPRAAAGRGRASSSSANGVFFVSLAPIRDWELVVPTIAQTLGLREQPGETRARDADRVPARQGAAARARQLRAGVRGRAASWPGCSRPRRSCSVLVTSRTPLRLSGERAYRVPPLGRLRRTRSQLFAEPRLRRRRARGLRRSTDENARGGRGDLPAARRAAARDRAGGAARARRSRRRRSCAGSTSG